MEEFLVYLPTFLFSMCLIYFLIVGKMLNRSKTIQLIMTIFCILLFAIFNLLIVSVPMSILLKTLLYSFEFVNINLIIYSFFMILQEKKLPRKTFVLSIIPFLIATFIDLSAFFNPYVFTISNRLIIHVLGYTSITIDLIYVIISIFQVFLEKEKNSKEKYYMVILLSINTIVSMLLCLIFDIYHLFTIGMLINISIYMTYFVSCNNSKDLLTGAWIRKKFYKDYRLYKKSVTYLMFFDLNNLKYLNDHFGHHEGDLALKTICNIINNNIPSKTYLYRVGGDEFVVLCRKVNEEQVKDIVSKIQEDFKTTNYSAAVGYVKADQNIPVEKLLQVADKEMYKDKNNSKFNV